MNCAKLEEFVVYRTDRASRCRQYVKQIHKCEISAAAVSKPPSRDRRKGSRRCVKTISANIWIFSTVPLTRGHGVSSGIGGHGHGCWLLGLAGRQLPVAGTTRVGDTSSSRAICVIESSSGGGGR